MAREKTTLYATQDGADFYIYLTPSVQGRPYNTWTYKRGRVSMNDLASAERAREAFVEQCEFAGYVVEFPNPFPTPIVPRSGDANYASR